MPMTKGRAGNMRFRELLAHHFRVHRGPDNMPVLAEKKWKGRRGDCREDLAMLMRDLKFRTGVEIGTGGGKSARMWCEIMPELRLTCVDPYREAWGIDQKRQDENFAKAQEAADQAGFSLLRIASLEAADRFADRSLDFVHVDGDHRFDFCMMDILRWGPKLQTGGLMLVHAYCHQPLSGVVQAVDAYTHCHRINPWYVTGGSEPTAFWQRGAEVV